MRTFVINLDEDAERLQDFLRANAHLDDVERFSAVDGASLDRPALAAGGYIEEDLKYTDGYLGAGMSHIGLWEKTVRDNAPCLIAEDDAFFARNFEPAARQLLSVDPDWEFVAWGFNFNSYVWGELPGGLSRLRIMFNEGDLRSHLSRLAEFDIEPTLIRLKHYFGSCAYSISPRGAAKLLDLCLPVRNAEVRFEAYPVKVENLSFDTWVNTALPKLNAYVSIPPLVVTPRDQSRSAIARVDALSTTKP